MMKCIRLIEPNVDENVILQSLLNTPKGEELTMFHFDVTSSVNMNLNAYLGLILPNKYLITRKLTYKVNWAMFYVIQKVQKGLHEFLFKLLILRYLMDSEGKTWKCSDKQLYLIEMLEPTVMSTRNVSRQVRLFTFWELC